MPQSPSVVQAELPKTTIDVHEPAELLNPRRRVSFGIGPGATVQAWPSKGGFYTHHCSVVELDFLGLDRFETVPGTCDPTEEDALSANLRKLGAVWWRTLDDWVRKNMGLPELTVRKVYAGWPAAGGVWVLETNYRDVYDRDLGRIGNARDMDERCRLIERFGGIFYEDPADCPHLDLAERTEGESWD